MAAQPKSGWSGPEGRERARHAVAGMLEELGLAGDEAEGGRGEAASLRVARTLTRDEFQARGLGQMLRVVYRNTPHLAVTDCRPDLATWRHEPVHDDYWRGTDGIERAKAATARMLAELEVPERGERAEQEARMAAARVGPPVFDWYGLGQVLEIVYAGSAEAALRAVLPCIPPWRHERSPMGYWSGIEGVEHAQAATRRLIGEYGWGGLSAEEVAARLTRKMFLQHGLSGMLDSNSHLLTSPTGLS